LAQLNPKEVIAIDGKTIRGAKSNGLKSPVHMVSAWANGNNLVLGQVKVFEKLNKITAIRKPLEVLTIKDTIVAISAMGCQTDIVKKILKNKPIICWLLKEINSSYIKIFKMNFNLENRYYLIYVKN
jgi:hypothetical protein